MLTKLPSIRVGYLQLGEAALCRCTVKAHAGGSQLHRVAILRCDNTALISCAYEDTALLCQQSTC